MEEKIDISEIALNYFREGFSCSEATLRAANDYYNMGLSSETLKIATTFGAGFGGSKCSCGTVTGGEIVLGTLFGRTSSDQSAKKAFETSKKLHDKFKESFGHICCRILIKNYDWASQERKSYCEKFVAGGSEIIKSIIDEENNK